MHRLTSKNRWPISLRNLLLAALAVLLAPSCTEEIDITLRTSDVRLVIEGGIGIEPGAHTVILSRTTGYFETSTDIPYVEDAHVTITEFDENMQLTGRVFHLTEKTKKGHYETESDVYGKQRHTYRLDISNVNIGGQTNYTADAFFPPIADRIDSIRAVWDINLLFMLITGSTRDTNSGRTGWNIEVFADDPAGENYYALIVYNNGIPLNDTLTQFLLLDNQMVDQSNIGLRGLPMAFVSDSSWFPVMEGDTLTLEIRGVSADYYRYLFEFRTVYGGSNPMFGGAPANVRGNVSGGAIGYFWANGSRKASDVADKSKRPTFDPRLWLLP